MGEAERSGIQSLARRLRCDAGNEEGEKEREEKRGERWRKREEVEQEGGKEEKVRRGNIIFEWKEEKKFRRLPCEQRMSEKDGRAPP